MYLVQSISLRRDKYSKGEAMDWIHRHGYKPIKDAHITQHFYQFRLVDPERLKGGRFRTIDLGQDGHMIVFYSGH
jgi:hypothetical protein